MTARWELGAVALTCALATACPSSIAWEEGRAYPCDGGGGECPGGWTCGITGICQPTTPGPYPCLRDQDCAGGWRCSSDQRCVDPSLDRLPAGLSTVPPAATAIHPQLFAGPPDRLSVSPPTVFPGGGTGHSIAAIEGTQVTLGLHADDIAVRSDGGTADFAFARIDVDQVSVGSPVAVATARRRAFILYDHGVGQFAPFTAGVPLATQLPLPFSATELYVTHDVDQDTLVVAHDSAQVAVWRLDDDAGFVTSQLLRVDGGQLTLLDVASLSGSPEALLAATDEGLFLGDRADAGAVDPISWSPLETTSLLHLRCNGSPGGPVAQRLVPTAHALLLEIEPGLEFSRDLQPWTQFADERSRVSFSGPCALYDPLGISFSPILSPCSDGAALVAGNALPSDLTTPQYRFHCANARSCTTTSLNTANADCITDLDYIVSSANVSWGGGFVGSNGQLWANSPSLVSIPVTPGHPPAVVLGRGDGLRLVDSTLASGVLELKIYRPAPGSGLVVQPRLTEYPGEPLAGVEGTASWIVAEVTPSPQRLQVLAMDELTTVAQGDGVVGELPLSEQFKAPYHALLAPLADGGTELVVSAFDALLAADVTPRLKGDSTDPVPVVVKAVPLSRSPILSIAAVPPRPGEVASGYLLTPSSLFSFGAQTQAHWRVEEISMPRDDWMSVWTDHQSGRVGYPDGVIYSLPSRVPISMPLPVGVPQDQVHQYASVCGQPFALTEQGMLLQLDPQPGDPRGQWATVLPFQVAYGAPSDFRMHADGSSLVVVDGELTVASYEVICGP